MTFVSIRQIMYSTMSYYTYFQLHTVTYRWKFDEKNQRRTKLWGDDSMVFKRKIQCFKDTFSALPVG